MSLCCSGLHKHQRGTDCLYSSEDHVDPDVSSQDLQHTPDIQNSAQLCRPIGPLGVVMDPLNPRECSGGHTEDKLFLASIQPVNSFASGADVKIRSC